MAVKKRQPNNSKLPKIAEDDFIEESVRFINEKANETLYKGSLEIGEYLLKHFFNDDITLASSKNPHKPKSFKALCKHRDLAVPYSTLTIMVRVAAQERFFREHHVPIAKLSYTHKSDLIRLKNDDEKLALASKCIEESLSTRQLSSLISKKRQKVIEHNKMGIGELAFSNIAKVEQLLNKSMKSELITDINKLRSMRTKTREDLKNKASELLDSISNKAKECRKLIKNLEKVEREKF